MIEPDDLSKFSARAVCTGTAAFEKIPLNTRILYSATPIVARSTPNRAA